MSMSVTEMRCYIFSLVNKLWKYFRNIYCVRKENQSNNELKKKVLQAAVIIIFVL